MDALRTLHEGSKPATLTNRPQVARDPPSTCGRSVSTGNLATNKARRVTLPGFFHASGAAFHKSMFFEVKPQDPADSLPAREIDAALALVR